VKNGEPKKSTVRYGGQSDSEQDKQTLKEKRKRKKNSWFRNSRILVLVLVLPFSIQSCLSDLEPVSGGLGALPWRVVTGAGE
jgi:hypothetical protein